LQIRSGNDVVLLDRYLISDGADSQPTGFTIKSISTKLEVLRQMMIGTSSFCDWRSTFSIVRWRTDIDPNFLEVAKRRCAGVDVSEEENKKRSDFILRVNVTPDLLNEVDFCFISTAPKSKIKNDIELPDSITRKLIKYIKRIWGTL
jgi:hypothetical protein